MTPNQFLLYSIQHKAHLLRSWLISIFAVTRESEDQKKQVYPGKLVVEPFGFFVHTEADERIKLDTTKKPGEPLFTLSEKITINSDWLSSVKEPNLDTTVGLLILNLICLHEPYRGKIPYWNKPFTPSDAENYVAPRLVSNPKPGEPRKDDGFYVDEYLAFCKAVGYMETFSNVFTHSITRQGLAPAPGRKEFKKEVLTRYEGKLQDPVEMAKFEEELQQFDNAYLKSDPANGKFMKGKVKAARMSAFMTQGGEANNFAGDMNLVPIVPALEDGIPLDAEGFTAISNTIRYGSFARGAETVNGGVVAKSLMQAADNWRITKGDCGTKLGMRRIYGEKDIGEFVGRYILANGEVKLVENIDQAKELMNKKIIVRSPQYCRREGTQTCEICAGVALSKYPTGIPIPLSELSGGILADSLKQMHNTKLETATMKLSGAIS